MPLKISIFGAAGRMGQEVTRLIQNDSAVRILPPPELSQKIKKKLNPDAIIDFSSPQGLAVLAQWCGQNKIPLVSGTTGLTSSVEKELKKAAKAIPVFWSPNMSVGLNSMALAVKNFAKSFEAGEVSIEEVHHKNKKDNPSGTAKLLHKIVKENVSKNVIVSEPVGLRGGEVFGIHKIYFFFDGEWVCFEHHAGNRSIFGLGAIKVTKWLVKQKPGFYEMQDFFQRNKS